MYKKTYIIIFIVLMIATISVVSATNVENSTSDKTQTIKKTATTDAQIATQINEKTKKTNKEINKKDKTNVKTDGEYDIDSENDFDKLFTKTGNAYYLKSSIPNESEIRFNIDISKTGRSYVINKPITILGNNHTLTLNTGLSYAKTSLNFISTASNSSISDIKFLNTQIYVNTSSNITFDNITAEVTNNGVGQGVGAFSIRDGSINITVKNSDFITNNNGGYSTLVLTWAENCTIDHNNITGIGSVGNLVYLNNYGASSNANNITKNSGNIISNNNITGPNPGSWLCYSVAITGPNNTIVNNTISNYGSYAITTTWAGSFDNTTDPEDTHNVTYFGNKYINNNVTGGFSTGNYSIVQNNNITGTSTIVGHANVTGNNFYGQVTLQNDVDFQNNNATNNNVYVKLPNCHIKDSTIKLLNVSVEANPTYNCTGNNFIDGVVDTSGNLVTCNGNYIWTQTNMNGFLTKKYSSNTKEYNEDYNPEEDSDYWVETIDEDNHIYVIHVTDENRQPVWNGDQEVYVTDFWKSKVPINMTYYLECEFLEGYNFDYYAYPGNTTYSLNGKTLYQGLMTGRKTTGSKYAPVNEVTIQDFSIYCDNDYYIDGTDGNGWHYIERGNYPFLGPMPTLLKNASITFNLTEDNLESIALYGMEEYNFISENLLNKTTFDNCTFNIGLPVQKIRQYTDGTMTYHKRFIPVNLFNSLNLTVTNCTFNVFCTSAEEDITSQDAYPCFMNMTSTDNKIKFIGNTINLNNVKGFILNTNNAIIENNTITTNCDYVAEITGNNNIVKDNTLVAKELTGNYAVLVTGTDNIVENNGPVEVKESEVNVTTEDLEVGETTSLTAVFYTDNNEQIMEGTAIFKINGKTLRDKDGNVIYVEITDGKATSPELNITQEWTKEETTIQAVYVGNDNTEPISTTPTTISITKPKADITITASTTATAGENITLKATVSSGDKAVSSGRVTFKLNGKTLKDADGKTLYANVENGEATLTYKIPEKTKAKEYILKAVFTDTIYDRQETNSTLTVVKA